MTAQELQALIEAIDARESDLRTRIEGERERAAAEMTSQLDGVVGDGADYAGARVRAGIETELVERHVRDLAALQAARARLKEGRYGVCPDCGESIGFERLKANPAALRCADCQSRREKAFAGGR